MRKRVFGRKLSRERNTRSALFVSLIENFVGYGKIITTNAKAKSVVGLIDRLVVLSKKDSLSTKRQVVKILRGNKKIATLLWTDVAKTFEKRSSGFTRIIPLLQRRGDGAQMVRLEWVEPILKQVKPITKKEKVKKQQ